MGVTVEVFADGLRVPGRQRFRAAELDSFGDHRIAMAFAVAALAGEGESAIEGRRRRRFVPGVLWAGGGVEEEMSRCARTPSHTKLNT